MGFLGFGRNSNTALVENKTISLINNVVDDFSDCDALSDVRHSYIVKESVAMVYFFFLPQIAGDYSLSRQEFQSVSRNVFKHYGLSSNDCQNMDDQYVLYQRIRQSEGVVGVAKEVENRISNLADDGIPCSFGRPCKLNLKIVSNFELHLITQDVLTKIMKSIRG